MEREKIALGALVVIIIAILGLYILSNEGVLDNLMQDEEKIEIGDCADVQYTLRYASNNTIIQETSEDEPLQVFVSKNSSEMPPEGYSNYSSGMIEGFMDELIGLKENEECSFTLSPEEAYGYPPEINDTIAMSSSGSPTQVLVINNIKENIPMPLEFQQFYGSKNTTIFVLRSNISKGDEMTLYPTWNNASIVTKINETTAHIYTTPPEDKMTNFTWINNTLGFYWENSTSVLNMNETVIVIEHLPDIGDTMSLLDLTDPTGRSSIEYNVVNITSNKINCSYENSEGNTSYELFNRTMEIQRNQTQSLITEIPKDFLNEIITWYPQYGINVDVSFSLSPLAGESLTYDVTVTEVYKTSEES